MKTLAKILSLLLVISLLASMLATVSFAEDPASVVSQTLVSGENAYSFFRYTPADFNFRGNNTPLIYVLGDKPYTEETANTALNELGFRQIADKESCTVLFVSPSDSAAWGEDDYAMMQALAGNATDNYFYGTDYSAGVSEEGKFFSSRFRHYIFAEGTGAAFAKQYLDVDGACYYMPEWYSWCDAFGAGYVYAEDSLTAKAVADGWENVRHTNRMFINNRVSFLTPYYYWDEMNVAETMKTFETKYEEIGTLEYYMYVPETVDLNSKTEAYDCSMNMCVALDMKGWKYPKNYLKDGRIVDPMKEKRPAKTGLILSLNSVSILPAWVVRHISLLHPSGFVGMYLTVRTFLRTRSYPVFWNALKICPEAYSEKQSFICCSLC